MPPDTYYNYCFLKNSNGLIGFFFPSEKNDGYYMKIFDENYYMKNFDDEKKGKLLYEKF